MKVDYTLIKSPVELAEKLFSNSPQDSNTIPLEIEDMDMGDLFEFLLIVFTNGLKSLYGNENGKVNLGDLSEEQFGKVNQYFNSIGFDTTYVVYPLEAENMVDFNKLSYRNADITSSTQLDDLCFPMKVSDKIYVIGFKFRLPDK
jgi:hypothetical protein